MGWVKRRAKIAFPFLMPYSNLSQNFEDWVGIDVLPDLQNIGAFEPVFSDGHGSLSPFLMPMSDI
jgi:hypothetical protein